MIILLKNEQTLENLINLFTNTFDHQIAGYKKFDNYFCLNDKKLLKSLNELNLDNISVTPMKRNISSEIKTHNPVLNLLGKEINLNEFLNKAGTYSYLISAIKKQ